MKQCGRYQEQQKEGEGEGEGLPREELLGVAARLRQALNDGLSTARPAINGWRLM